MNGLYETLLEDVNMGYELILPLSLYLLENYQGKLHSMGYTSKKSFSVYKEDDSFKLRMGLYNIPTTFSFNFDQVVELWCAESSGWTTERSVDALRFFDSNGLAPSTGDTSFDTMYSAQNVFDQLLFSTGSAFTFMNYSLYTYTYNALARLFEKAGQDIPMNEEVIGDISLIQIDCTQRGTLQRESIYFRVSFRWIRHRLDLIDFNGACYLNIAKDQNSFYLKLGTSFLSDYFTYFDGELGSVHLLSIDDQAYPSAEDFEKYEDLPDEITEFKRDADKNFFERLWDSIMEFINSLKEYFSGES
mmetsp:Transcript_13212/g.22411  ORF Transcript_13212/g.22411 Transcript_13212/m.22411 type:complete len:303 (-) Transcript_13212:74-982(-)|eukprot:CAMPEP_0168614350 /NCGR_PEP_ID=MMETSP0449_2-20121227/3927_1 /TAXON_ID=1082188 /ORGANISM="Strombidium rassoulzadegani, Strain ras09" /LENGTH=302 /DNA_ID=CAMNT_0008655023 /DNA_START=468 /DNA_END=1376 /DNA_ORIENTATION=-